MQIPYGHRVKILKKIKEFRAHKSKNEEASIQAEVMNTTFSEMGVGVGTDMNEGENKKDNKKNEDLEFDEEEQQRLFREAVEEFRRGKNKENTVNNNNNQSAKKISVIKEVDEEVNEVKLNSHLQL